MTTTNIPAPPGIAGGPLIGEIIDRCPRCAGDLLYTVFDGEHTNFLCRSCNRCWHVTPGGAQEVDRTTCPGCEWRFACRSRWD
jgi:hypothetical protein